MGDAAALDRVGQRLHHRILADQLAEALRPVFAGQHAVGRGRDRRLLGQIEAEARRFGIGHCRVSKRRARSLRAERMQSGNDGKVEADDPARNRCGCFLPDLTRLATAPSADFRGGIWVRTRRARKLSSAPASCARPAGCARVSVSSSSVSRIWQASREVRVAWAARSSMSSSSSLAGGSLAKSSVVDDDVAGRAGHHALARALERLFRRPGDVEQPLARLGLDFAVERPVGLEEAHQGHAAKSPCARGRLVDQPERVDQLLLARVAAEAEPDRRARLAVAKAERAQHMARPPRSAGAGRAERESDVAQVGDQPRGIEPVAADVEVAAIALLGAAVERPAGPKRRPAPPATAARHARGRRRDAATPASPPRRTRRTAPATACPSAARAPARRRGAAAPARRRRASTRRRCPWARGPCAPTPRPGRGPRGIGTRPSPWTASHSISAPASWAAAAISATGWITPISLLTSIAATSSHALVELAPRAGRGRPGRRRPTGKQVTSTPCPASHSQLSSTAACSVATVTIRLRPPAAFSHVPLSAQLSASVAPPVKASEPPSSPIAASTWSRATSTAAAASLPEARGRVRVGELAPRSTAASPPRLRARAGSSLDSRDRSCGPGAGPLGDPAPFGEEGVDVGLATSTGRS